MANCGGSRQLQQWSVDAEEILILAGALTRLKMISLLDRSQALWIAWEKARSDQSKSLSLSFSDNWKTTVVISWAIKVNLTQVESTRTAKKFFWWKASEGTRTFFLRVVNTKFVKQVISKRQG